MQLIASALAQPTWVRNVRDVAGRGTEAWFASLPNLLEALRENWGLSSLAVRPGLTYGLILYAEHRGRPAILKIFAPGMPFAAEVAWYRAQAAGVPEVWGVDEARGAILLECVRPGTEVAELADDVANFTMAAAIRALGQARESDFPFKPVTELASALNTLDGRVPETLLTRAREIFRGRGEGDHVLHGDVHHHNVLLASEGSFRVIDPHGYRGPRAFEVGCLFHNPVGWRPANLSSALARRVDIMTSELPFTRDEILDWAFAYTLMSVAWSAEDGREIPPWDFEVARLLDRL